jgi:hypothetical protein
MIPIRPWCSAISENSDTAVACRQWSEGCLGHSWICKRRYSEPAITRGRPRTWRRLAPRIWRRAAILVIDVEISGPRRFVSSS